MNLLIKNGQEQSFITRYEILSIIQEGSQARILLARKNGQLFGIKVYKHGYKGLEMFSNQIEILETINDNLVIKPLQFYQVRKNFLDDEMKENVEPFLVMEYFEHGDLRNYLNKGNMTKRIRNHVLKNLALCLTAIQSRGILHCDIKPENFLISSDYIIKIIDFGYGMPKDKLKPQLVGTTRYIAPEIYKQKKYSEKSQVFALGVIFFQLALPTHEFPFKEAKITDPNYLQIFQKNYAKFWSKFNAAGIQIEYKKLIQKMLAVNPEERPTVRDVLSCSFLQDSGSFQQCKQYFSCLKPICKGIKLENCNTY